MAWHTYHTRKIGEHTLALKPPIFLISTFTFETAQEGKDFFDVTSGRRVLPEGKQSGLVFSRFNNPNLEVLEDRLALWEGGAAAAVFSSGMSAATNSPLMGGIRRMIA